MALITYLTRIQFDFGALFGIKLLVVELLPELRERLSGCECRADSGRDALAEAAAADADPDVDYLAVGAITHSAPALDLDDVDVAHT